MDLLKDLEDVNNKPYEIVFYQGLFKIHKVEIIARKKYADYSLYSISYYYKYLIRFKSGKMKFVRNSSLIFQNE